MTPFRGTLASSLVALLCLASGVLAFGVNEWSLVRPAQRAKDLAHRFDARLEPVRKALPAGVEVVSYWSDDSDTGLRQLVHYAMAPVLVDEALPPSREFLVVDLRKSGGAPPADGYTAVRQLGPGLILLRRPTTP